MAYKINGTTVVDNSRNVCACCVTSCCITASDRLDAPSGTTASRPASPTTGSLYFDTDESSLLSYNGTEWTSVGGGVSQETLTPVTDWIGPYFCCCTSSISACGCCSNDFCVLMNPWLCQVIIPGLSCNSSRCGTMRWFTFNPSTCTVSYDCCSCPACRGCNGFFRTPKFNCCFWCVQRTFKMTSNSGFTFRDKTIFRPEHGCDVNCFIVMTTDPTCSVCMCYLGCTTYQCCCGPVHNLCVGADMSNDRIWMTPDACCAVSFITSGYLCLCCCAGTATTLSTPGVVFWQGPIIGSSGYENFNIHPVTNPSSGLLDYACTCGFTTFMPMAVFCNGALLRGTLTSNCVRLAIVFLCNDGTTVPVMECCSDGSTRAEFRSCEGTYYPTSISFNGFYRLNKDYVGFEFWGCRCCTRVYWGFMKHSEGTTCFDVNANCHKITMIRQVVSNTVATAGNSAGRCCLGHCLPGCGSIGSYHGEGLFDFAGIKNTELKFSVRCNDCQLCTFVGGMGFICMQKFYCCSCQNNLGCNVTCTWHPSGQTTGLGMPPAAYSAELKPNTLDPALQNAMIPGNVTNKILSDGACFNKCINVYGPLCCYEGATDTICTCHMSLECIADRKPHEGNKFYIAVSCATHCCCEPPSTTLIAKSAHYIRIYCG